VLRLILNDILSCATGFGSDNQNELSNEVRFVERVPDHACPASQPKRCECSPAGQFLAGEGKLFINLNLPLTENSFSLPKPVAHGRVTFNSRLISGKTTAMDKSEPQQRVVRFKTWQKCLFLALFMLGIASPFLFVWSRSYYQNYTTASNSMAPTILGKHWVGVCEECGAPAYCSPAVEGFDPSIARMICDRFHVTHADDFDTTVHPADRFFVAKRLKPRRWDLIAFQLPEDPQTSYIMRLVGLPGETVVVKNGNLWIDGQQASLPRELQGLKYSLPEFILESEVHGNEKNPARLGTDEYFVLGDFSQRARDSRMWTTGAAGHSPYAIPASYIIGVATRVYWPPNRIRSLRIDAAETAP
jgi:signal peptidase I